MTSLFDELSFKIPKNENWLFFSFSTVNLILGCCSFRKVKKRSASVSPLKRQNDLHIAYKIKLWNSLQNYAIWFRDNPWKATLRIFKKAFLQTTVHLQFFYSDKNIVNLIPKLKLCFHHLKSLHCFQWKTRYHSIWDPMLFINLFVVAVKLITLVAQSDTYHLGLKNIGNRQKVPRIQTSKWVTKMQDFKQ